jgi:hypothetical protein
MDFEPLHTKVEKTIQTTLGWVVLESPKEFPRNESNLYFISLDGKIKWKAERPDAGSLYSRVKLNEDGDTLSAYTISGHSCELDLKTGKLISHTSIQ